MNMLSFMFRSFWRAVIFIGGALIIYITATETYRYADERINAFFAGFIVYCILAYFIIPLLFRLYHLVFKHDRIPLYVTSADGWASDPVNIALVCEDKRELISHMSRSGWHESDYGSIGNLAKEAFAIVFNTSYPEAPVSNLYLFNRRQDISFQIPTNDKNSPRSRHHVRFWRLQEPHPDKHDYSHFDFWHNRLDKWKHLDKEIWIGACTEDTSPLGVRYRTGTITHRISSDADKERDFLIKTLRNKGLIKSIHNSDKYKNIKFRGQSGYTTFTIDGSIKVVITK